MKFYDKIFGVILFSFSLFANASLINFDDIDAGNAVDDFYASQGVDFLSADWIVASGFGETSEPNFAVSLGGNGFMNVTAGFTNQLTFTYGAFIESTVSIFDNINGTGTLLASVVLAANDVNAFDFQSILFSGTAFSVSVESGLEQFGWDDVSFTKVTEPSILALLGLGLIGLSLSRRKSN